MRRRGWRSREKDIASLVVANRNRLVGDLMRPTYGFGAESAAPWLPEYDNLIVTRSLSKSHALAGLRVGYAHCATRAH